MARIKISATSLFLWQMLFLGVGLKPATAADAHGTSSAAMRVSVVIPYHLQYQAASSKAGIIDSAFASNFEQPHRVEMRKIKRYDACISCAGPMATQGNAAKKPMEPTTTVLVVYPE